jgi:hypothetical protein
MTRPFTPLQGGGADAGFGHGDWARSDLLPRRHPSHVKHLEHPDTGSRICDPVSGHALLQTSPGLWAFAGCQQNGEGMSRRKAGGLESPILCCLMITRNVDESRAAIPFSLSQQGQQPLLRRSSVLVKHLTHDATAGELKPGGHLCFALRFRMMFLWRVWTKNIPSRLTLWDCPQWLKPQ